MAALCNRAGHFIFALWFLSEGCKNYNAFLVHCLAERDDIWHDEGQLSVAHHLLFW